MSKYAWWIIAAIAAYIIYTKYFTPQKPVTVFQPDTVPVFDRKNYTGKGVGNVQSDSQM